MQGFLLLRQPQLHDDVVQYCPHGQDHGVAFFDSKGLIYTHIMLRGITIDKDYTAKAMGKSLVHIKKRPKMVQQEWIFYWDIAPMHATASVKKWFANRSNQLLPHHPTTHIS